MKQSIEQLLKKFEELDVQLWVENGELRFKAPLNIVTEERKNELRKYKKDIINYLVESQKRLEHDEIHRYNEFALTDIQSAYLLGRENVYECGGVGCHGYIELEIAETLDISKLEVAWNKVILRHDMLRAKIYKQGYQRVEKEVTYQKIEVQDLRDSSSSEIDEAIQGVRKRLEKKQYNPEEWPLYEICLTILNDKSILHLSNDMLIMDFVGANIILNELGCYYAHPENELPPLEITFRDVFMFEKQKHENVALLAKRDADKEYWNKMFEDVVPIPEMPIYNTSPEDAEFEYKEFLISEVQWNNICHFARENRLTGSNVILTAFAEVIRLWSKTPQFCINLTLLNRPEIHEQIDNIVGDFTTINILKVDMSEGENLLENALILQKRLWDNMEHNAFSGVEVLRELGHKNNRNTMVPIVFTSTLGVKKKKWGENSIGEAPVVYKVSQTPQVYIDCQVSKRENGVIINWDVRKGIFMDGVIDAAFTSFKTLLIELADSEDTWRSHAPARMPKYMDRIRNRINATKKDVISETLITPFIKNVEKNPNKTAVISKDIHYSYQLLSDYAEGIKCKLIEEGFKPGDLAGVLYEKGIWQIASVLGILFAGGAYVPLDMSQPDARILSILDDADIKYVLSDRTDIMNSDEIKIINPEKLDIIYNCKPNVVPVHFSSIGYLIYTSGTTGIPKGVVITHQAAMNTILDINKKFNINEDDKILSVANLAFDLSVYDIFGCFMAGATIVLPDSELKNNPEHWMDLINKEHITVWNSVPAQMQLLLSCNEKSEKNTLRLALLSGDWIPVQLPGMIKNKFPECDVISLGGATEASIWSIYHKVEEKDEKLRSIPYGTPLTNQFFRILNKDMKDCPDYVIGNIYIGGVGLAEGYYKDEDLTAKKFVKDLEGHRLYDTGDTGRYYPNGTIEFCGREDTQVKIRGHRIELSEIESVLQKHPKVTTAVAVVTGANNEARIKTFVEPMRENLDSEIHRSIRKRLSDRSYAAGERVTSNIDRNLIKEWMTAADRTTVLDIMSAFQSGGIFKNIQEEYSLDEMMQKLKVEGRFRRLLKRWLNVLCKEQVATFNPNTMKYQMLFMPDKEEIKESWSKLYAVEERLKYGEKLIQYLKDANKHILELLQGDIGALDIFFPKGETTTAMAAYHDNIVNLALNQIAKENIANMVHEIGFRSDNKTIRILEIGAGVGGTSVDIIPALDGLNVEYHFTDISNFFINEAKKKFNKYEWVKYGLFDINKDYKKQGIEAFSYDIIVCANVLHNAKNITDILKVLKEIAVPGGYMIMIEATKEAYTLLTSMEFNDGLRGFTDFRGMTDRTFIDYSKWIELFETNEINVLCGYPRSTDLLSEAGQSIFIVEFPKVYAKIHKDQLTSYMRQYLPEYMIPSEISIIPKFPTTANGKIDRKKLVDDYVIDKSISISRDDMPIDDLEKRIAIVWETVLNREFVGRNENFYVIGGDSLLIAQVIAKMREEIDEAREWEWDELMREILQTPTISEIATKLKNRKKYDFKDKGLNRQLVLLADSKEENAMVKVLIHGGTGTLTPYNSLLGYLVNDPKRKGKIVGFTFGNEHDYLSLDCETLISSLGERYAHILAELNASSYEIIGYCMGGLIGLEVAKILMEENFEVKRVVTIDTSFGQRSSEAFINNEAQLNLLKTTLGNELLMERVYGLMIGADVYEAGHTVSDNLLKEAINELGFKNNGDISLEALCHMKGKFAPVAECYKELSKKSQIERLQDLFGTIKRQEEKLEVQQTYMLEILFRVFNLSFQSVTYYDPEPFAGDLVALKCSEEVKHFLPVIFPTEKEDWENISLGDFRFKYIGGNHVNCLQEPYARSLAKILLEEEDE